MRPIELCRYAAFAAITCLLCCTAVSGDSAEACRECREVALRALRHPYVMDAKLVPPHPDSAYERAGLGPPVGMTCFGLTTQDSSRRGYCIVDHQRHGISSFSIERPVWSFETDTEPWDAIRGRSASSAAVLLPSDHLELLAVEPAIEYGSVYLTYAATIDHAGFRVWLPRRVTIRMSIDTASVIGANLVAPLDPAAARLLAPDDDTVQDAISAGARVLGVEQNDLAISPDIDCTRRAGVGNPRTCWQWTLTMAVRGQTTRDEAKWVDVALDADGVAGISEFCASSFKDSHVRQIALSGLERRLGGIRHALPFPAFVHPSSTITDRYPTWSADGRSIIMLSQRPHAGAPWWRRRTAVMRIDLASKRLSYLEPAWSSSLETLSVAGPLVVATSKTGQLLLLDHATGATARQGMWSEFAYHCPALSPSANSIVYCGSRARGDSDLFVAELSGKDQGLLNQRRLLKDEGKETCPILSLDGALVYFVQAVSKNQGCDTQYSLCSVSSRDVYLTNKPPKKLIEGLPDINRLSHRQSDSMLISHAQGVDLLGLHTLERRPLPLQDLHDSDIPSAKPIQVREADISPDGQTIVFAGVSQTLNGSDISHIYTCDLRGRNLTRLTSLNDAPVPPYRFPESRQSAFDIAKRVAMSEERHQTY